MPKNMPKTIPPDTPWLRCSCYSFFSFLWVPFSNPKAPVPVRVAAAGIARQDLSFSGAASAEDSEEIREEAVLAVSEDSAAEVSEEEVPAAVGKNDNIF